MITDATKKTVPASNSANRKTAATGKIAGRGPQGRRPDGYTRIKSGEHKRRSVTRTPDMSNPNGRVLNPNVSLGTVPANRQSAPVAAIHVEPKVRTINDPNKVPFPYSIIFLSLICSVLFFYMIFNYVQINEHTSTVSDLKNEITTLSTQKNDLDAKLDLKNDLVYIEKVAREELGMVKIDEITKKYITMDPGDVIKPLDLGSAN
ncbi:MAG: septum formation initiator family protein [Ruminococcaceae bacterium]|nr:septum formation initiator family protein [Oscillospiraceae bacterium]